MAIADAMVHEGISAARSLAEAKVCDAAKHGEASTSELIQAVGHSYAPAKACRWSTTGMAVSKAEQRSAANDAKRTEAGVFQSESSRWRPVIFRRTFSALHRRVCILTGVDARYLESRVVARGWGPRPPSKPARRRGNATALLFGDRAAHDVLEDELYRDPGPSSPREGRDCCRDVFGVLSVGGLQEMGAPFAGRRPAAPRSDSRHSKGAPRRGPGCAPPPASSPSMDHLQGCYHRSRGDPGWSC